ncbi:MAG: hypothetical protein JW726_06220 [Anaerolineales bacterium]|nr:hypothetical protein [Anaerolineales bacterium]
MNIASFLQVVAVIAWLIFFGSIVLLGMRLSRGKDAKGITTIVLITLVVAILLSGVAAGLIFIPPEQRGVVISAIAPNGYRENALTPGLHWIVPALEYVVTYPISRQTYTMSIASSEGQITGDDSVAARTSDGQEIYVDASVIYAIDPTQVVQVHIEWQSRYADDLVRPLARGIIRDAVSQYGVEEVYSTQRNELTDSINSAMAIKLEENGLVLVEFILRNITFSTEYAASVEQKQIAEQQAQQAVFVVEQKKQEAEQVRQTAQGAADAAVIAAEGEAEALIINAEAQAEARVIEANAESEALGLIAVAIEDNPDLLLYQYINHLAPGIRVMLVPTDNPFLLTLPSLNDSDVVYPDAYYPLPQETTPSTTP